MDDLQALKHFEEQFNYQFQKPDLLFEALNHRSFVNEQPESDLRDNERLEFLGDAVTNWLVTSVLWEIYPQASEGELTRKRASLVCEAGLADLAVKLGIHLILRLGKGEEKSDGRKKPRLLCSVFEACMGAFYLDAGLQKFYERSRDIFYAYIQEAHGIGELDHKSKLQELSQAQGQVCPIYQVVRTEGPAHDLIFFVSVTVGEKQLAVGQGRSKIEAEQKAAEQAIEQLVQE